jgi:predicted DNA-binding transcriptional regulator AlpA
MHTPNHHVQAYEVDPDKVLSFDEAAAMSGLSASTLKRRARAGDLRMLKLSPRRVGIRLSEFYRWLDACGV